MNPKTVFIFVAILIFSIPSAFAAKAQAALKGTTEGSPILGKVNFEETAGGLKVTAEVAGAPSGQHGFHIHENGSCDENGKAAGGHFNPDKVKHGLLSQDGFKGAHAGDLGNLEIGPEGSGRYEATFPNLSLSVGKYKVLGKSVILHEKVDNFGQPTGNAGSRIACGVIEGKK